VTQISPFPEIQRTNSGTVSRTIKLFSFRIPPCTIGIIIIIMIITRTQRGLPTVLGGDPKGKNFLYTNGNSLVKRNIEI
jgi:hypothetical protein